MANIEKIRKVVDFIEKMVEIDPDKFNMDEWGHESSKCGTVACFAGWAPIAFGEKTEGSYVISADLVADPVDGSLSHPHVADWALKELDLNQEEGNGIFYATFVESVADLKKHINYVLDEEVFAV
jgi:hypothetical protein